jgi:hypothetical protein
MDLHRSRHHALLGWPVGREQGQLLAQNFDRIAKHAVRAPGPRGSRPSTLLAVAAARRRSASLKLRADASARLSAGELQGAITKLGGKPKGKKAELKAQLQQLVNKHGLPASQAQSPPPPPAIAAASPATVPLALPLALARPRRGASA